MEVLYHVDCHRHWFMLTSSDFMLEPEDKVIVYEIRGRGCQAGEYLPSGCTV